MMMSRKNLIKEHFGTGLYMRLRVGKCLFLASFCLYVHHSLYSDIGPFIIIAFELIN